MTDPAPIAGSLDAPFTDDPIPFELVTPPPRQLAHDILRDAAAHGSGSQEDLHRADCYLRHAACLAAIVLDLQGQEVTP